jgi:hypothetical protein
MDWVDDMLMRGGTWARFELDSYSLFTSSIMSPFSSLMKARRRSISFTTNGSRDDLYTAPSELHNTASRSSTWRPKWWYPACLRLLAKSFG